MINQPFMVQSHEVEDRGMEVSHVVSIAYRFVAQRVRFTVTRTSLDPASGKPIGESLGIVIAATIVALPDRLTSKFPAPHDKGLVQ
jgi:hypothetical protein